ncbi:MAG: prepilin-type N-terminal cleavage/methylation domain-containing protein [Nitrospirae bacterium]|nr:prepilin-type N-terminal cleavage/methylation domain-containing protein [Nitrospirota bacterium]
MRNIKGFTLVEILLVVALLGMLAVSAFSTLFGAKENFAFLAEYKSIISVVRQARLQAVFGENIDLYDRYGIKFESDSIVFFGDTGMPFVYEPGVDHVEETVNIAEPYEITFSSGGADFPVYLYYENGTGDLTSYGTIGPELVLMEKSVVRRLDFQFTDGEDLIKYIYIFQVSGIAEESSVPF